MTDLSGYATNLLQRKKTQDTIDTYCGHIRRFFAFLHTNHQYTATEPLDSITVDMVAAFYTHLFDKAYKDATLNNYVCALLDYFAYLLRYQRITKDPTTCLHLLPISFNPRTDGKEAYTDKELLALYHACFDIRSHKADIHSAYRTWAFIVLNLATALRVSEIACLDGHHLQGIVDGSVRVRVKGNRMEEIAVARFAQEPIMAYLAHRGLPAEEAPLFVASSGKRWNRKRIWDAVSNVQTKAGVRTGIHVFRVTTISRLSHDYSLARDVARHSARGVTDRYMPTTISARKIAIESAFHNFLKFIL